VLKPENLFYLGTRSYESAEDQFVTGAGIFNRSADQLKTESDWAGAVAETRRRIGNRPFVVSFDFDSLDPKIFRDVLVPAGGGISAACAKFLLSGFRDAVSFEFVEYAPGGCVESAALVRDLISIVYNG
jgi:arginase family enzyme